MILLIRTWYHFFWYTKYGWWILPIFVIFFSFICKWTILLYWLAIIYKSWILFFKKNSGLSYSGTLYSDHICYSFLTIFIWYEPIHRAFTLLFTLKNNYNSGTKTFTWQMLLTWKFWIQRLKVISLIWVMGFPFVYITYINIFISCYNQEPPQNLQNLRKIWLDSIDLFFF